MKKLLSVFLAVAIIFCSIANFSLLPWNELAVVSYAADSVESNYTDVFHSAVFKLWWKLGFSGNVQIYEFSPDVIKFYTVDKINLDDYYAGDKEFVYDWGSYSVRSFSIPADVFEGQALKHFNINDIEILRNDTSADPVYNAETNTYDMLEPGGWGDSITYATKGYKNLGNGSYEVYGYTVEMAYEKPEDAIEGVDYIIHNGYPAEIVRCIKVTLEYDGTDVKFISWETVTLDEVPDIKDLIHNHISSEWITDTAATVNAPGSKHKECTECGEVLETATIAQLKPSTPTLKAIANTASGVKVSWNKVSGADNYFVYRRTYNATTKKWGGWVRFADGVTSTSYTDTTAKSGVYYIYTVRAKNEAGLSGYDSSGLKIKFLATPTLASIANNTGKVTVKWNKISGATGYIVYRKTYNASTKTWGGWSRLATTKSLSYNDTKAKSGTYYRYTVRAYSGDYTSYFDTTGLKTKYLATPTLKSVASAKSGVTVKWGKVTGATGYIVYRKTGSGSWKQVAVVEGNSKVSYLDKTAKKGTTYKYTVRAYYGSYRSYFNTKGLTIKDKY